MGIDIYASWKGQTDDELRRQSEARFRTDAGSLGYLREASLGEPLAVARLCLEAFEPRTLRVRIPAEVLRERLPQTLKIARERWSAVCDSNGDRERVLKSITDFVELCERVEQETGEPVTIIVRYWFQ